MDSFNYNALTELAEEFGGDRVAVDARMGGNLCDSSLSVGAVYPLIVSAAGAVIASRRGTRSVAAAEFVGAYQRFGHCNETDIAVADVDIAAKLSADYYKFEEVK